MIDLFLAMFYLAIDLINSKSPRKQSPNKAITRRGNSKMNLNNYFTQFLALDLKISLAFKIQMQAIDKGNKQISCAI